MSDGEDPPLTADAPDIPAEHALQGFAGVRAYASDPASSAGLLGEALGFTPTGAGEWEIRGEERHGRYGYDAPPPERGMGGAGTIHHVAFASRPEDHEEWGARVRRAGARPTPVIDRFYFRSIYFREPSGVLFELATIGPGFAVDEDPSALGERLSLPPAFEHLRPQLEQVLTPLPAVRSRTAG